MRASRFAAAVAITAALTAGLPATGAAAGVFLHDRRRLRDRAPLRHRAPFGSWPMLQSALGI